MKAPIGRLLLLPAILMVYFVFFSRGDVRAATTPDLGEASSFTILSGTYTNTVGGTTLNGDLGYTTGPATAPTVNGTTYSPPSTKYSSAGTDQGVVLVNLNSQPCTHTFPAGAVDLATDVSHGTLGVYAPGVYCTTASSAASIGAGGISLSGSGTFIFRIDGALTSVANSVVTLSGGASACDVFWTPAAATTLGANSTFAGTLIDDAGITIGSTVVWSGRALAFNGTVSTDTDTISTPSCTSPTPTPSTVSTSGSAGTTSAGAPVSYCPPLGDQIVEPEILQSVRIDPDSVYISWGPYSGANFFNVQYGPSNGNWKYSADVYGFSTTINFIPLNQPIWVRVAARNDCTVGRYGSAWFTGAPDLPNAGVATGENESLLLVSSGGFIFISSVFLRLFRK